MRSGIRPSVRHGQLQSERLVEPQSVPAHGGDCLIRRLMHCSEGCLQVRYRSRLADPLRQWILNPRQPVQREGRTVGDRPGAQLAGHGVEADERNAGGRRQRDIVLGAADHGTVLVEDDEVGMRELQPAVESCHLAREDASGTRLQLTLPVFDQSRLAEEGAGQPAPMVGDGGLKSRLARQPIVRAIRKIESPGVHDFRHDRDLLTFLE